VTWSDGALGCPAPGRFYTQALVPGFRVQLEAGGERFDYTPTRAASGRCAPRNALGRRPATAACEAIDRSASVVVCLCR
jgi:hypothetical protein